ncbi:MAG: hypothetical protein LBF09_06200, partial [Odoribacteraceae bacterium]|nr:hypothetical protein [Odoribacteraceae bacterium]
MKNNSSSLVQENPVIAHGTVRAAASCHPAGRVVKTAGISRIARLLAIILPVFLFSCEDTVTGNLSLSVTDLDG